MPRQQPPPASRPVAWALLSQSIWLPLLAIDLQDRWNSRVQDLTARAGAASDPAPLLLNPAGPARALSPLHSRFEAGPGSTGVLLGSGSLGRSSVPEAITEPIAAGSTGAAFSFPAAPASPDRLALLPPAGGNAALPLLQGGFSRAELLGGPITLADLNEGTIPPLALAERGRRSLAGDPLAALPDAWREPMRQALSTLPAPSGGAPRIGDARHVHVPSARVSRPTEVPLALQADGSVDILSRPDSEAVVEEIRDWSARQAPPAEGSVAPALVHLHPVAEAAPLRPTAADLLPATPVAPEPTAAAPADTPETAAGSPGTAEAVAP